MPRVSYSAEQQTEFLNEIGAFYKKEVLTANQIRQFVDSNKKPFPHFLFRDYNRKIKRGVYNIGMVANVSPLRLPPMPKVPQNKTVVVVDSTPHEVVSMKLKSMQADLSCTVPDRDPTYVPFGNYSDIETIIKSKIFFPVYVTGLSGNGKTMMVEQICAVEKREMVRVNITIETDEDDLIGGFRLVNGETVWQDGPVITAMNRGALLLLDEVDLGSNKLMCLQPVLEGKAVYLKKTNRVVHPAAGFNIIATANTKGKGSDDGRFIGTNVMNEAFLERFSITMEQEYPAAKIESKILNNVLGESGISNTEFVDKLVTWADVIRKSFYEGALSEIISTRRLVHICEAYAIFNQNKVKAIELCLNRFDVDTKNAFMELYKKVDDSAEPVGATGATGSILDEFKNFVS